MSHEEKLPTVIDAEVRDPGLQADFDFAKQNVKDAIDIAASALQSMAAIADQSQHPKAYDTLAKLLDSVVKANREFLEIRGVKKSLDPRLEAEKPQGVEIKNALIVTTADLQKMLLDARKD